MHIQDFGDFLNYLKTRKIQNSSLINICFVIYNNSSIKKQFTQISDIKNKIKTQIENDTKGIYTYLKITNFEHANQTANYIPPFNERFNIRINNDKRSMIMEYSNINMPFYVKSEKGLILNGEILERNSKGRVGLKVITETGGEKKILNEIEKIDYDNKFIFGNFNQIFTPEITYEQIADNLQVLIDKILTGKPLFIMGWGASGSGKTSTLIHYTAGNQPGILIHLCKNLAKIHKYTKIELVCKELFQPYYQNDSSNNANTDEDKFTFEYNEDKFKLTGNIDYKSRHVYRSKETTKSFTSSNDLGEVMQYLIDTDRLVKATTNNPNSSRSHVLCFLKLTGGPATAYIIFGDLAGVENTFKCSDPSTISKFMEVKRDGTKDRFYKDEIKDNKFDVIYGGNPYEFKGNEPDSFAKQMSKPFFNFNNADNLLTLYKLEEPTFFQPNTAVVNYVNLILKQFNNGLNVQNLNTQLLINGDNIQKNIINFEKKIANKNFKFNDNNSYVKEEFKKIVYGATGGTYKSEKLDPKLFNSYWNENQFKLLFAKIKECIFYNKIIRTACQNRVVE
jgi:hypothetical protein